MQNAIQAAYDHAADTVHVRHTGAWRNDSWSVEARGQVVFFNSVIEALQYARNAYKGMYIEYHYTKPLCDWSES